MKTQITLSLTLLVTFLIVFPHVHSSLNTTGDLSWWCNQTPNPNPCNYHMTHIPESAIVTNISRNQFLTIAEKTALDGVVSELEYVKSLEPRVLNNGERAAWSDCLLYYNLAINSLNKIVNVSTKKSTASDIQIWLSGASTNIFTCQDGFSDVKVTNNIYPLVISNNVTELITNCMAVNKVLFDEEKRNKPKGVRKSFAANDSIFETANSVVAQDGSGDYTTITAALEASNSSRSDVSQKYVIQVKQGTYAEYPVVTVDMKNIVIVGEGMDNTIVTGNKNITTTLADCATFKVYGDGFIAKDITFENTAGMDAGQAIALLSQSDKSAYYHCGFRGHQDTLLANMYKQFFRECEIYGTIDYIFGNAAVVVQQSTIYASDTDRGLVITAQGRKTLDDATGIVIHNCTVVAGPDLPQGGSPAYLGRPWKDYSTTIIMQTFLDSVVNPAGWLEWEGAEPGRDSTVYYAEFNNTGPGSATDQRVKWPGYHLITDPSDVEQYSVSNFIDGESWIPNTGVPFDSGI